MKIAARTGPKPVNLSISVLEVPVEPLADLLVELSDRSVDDGDLPGELGDELRAHASVRR